MKNKILNARENNYNTYFLSKYLWGVVKKSIQADVNINVNNHLVDHLNALNVTIYYMINLFSILDFIYIYTEFVRKEKSVVKIMYWSDRYILLKFFKIVSLVVDALLLTWFQRCKGSLEVSCYNLFQRLCDRSSDGGNILEMATFQDFSWALETGEQEKSSRFTLGLWQDWNPYIQAR